MRIQIGEVSDFGKIEKGKKNDPAYFMTHAMVELCGVDGELHDLMAKSEKRGKYVYFYPDGDTRTIEDCYGDRLKAIPAHIFMRHLKKVNVADSDGRKYRRYEMAEALLEKVIENFDKPYIMKFGH